MVGSEQRVLQQLVQDSLESSQAARGLHSWLARLQLELLGCHISAAAISRYQQSRRHPSSLPGSLCWHGLAAPWQGRVVALGRWKTRNLTIMAMFDNRSHRSHSKWSNQSRYSKNTTPTCFQVPEVFTTDLVVPSFTITVTATPHIESGVDGHSTVASTGPGDIVFKSIHQHCLPTHGVYRQTYGTKLNMKSILHKLFQSEI